MKTLEAALEKLSARNIFIRFYKYYIIDSILIVKREGFKALLKKRGWKVFAVVIGYYTVRDTILYIIVPFVIAQGLL
ncbi:MAG: hypothetical protein U5J96_10625 [Ignavibacteriaceae bacterium]|nr:hypothetical protein [Ignavibacteriaceae bacterium]